MGSSEFLVELGRSAIGFLPRQPVGVFRKGAGLVVGGLVWLLLLEACPMSVL